MYNGIKSSNTENNCRVKRTETRLWSQTGLQPKSINKVAAALESSLSLGLTLHDTKVKFLLKTDDLLLLPPTERGLQDSLEMMEKYSGT